MVGKNRDEKAWQHYQASEAKSLYTEMWEVQRVGHALTDGNTGADFSRGAFAISRACVPLYEGRRAGTWPTKTRPRAS